ncbi:hypothetical protein [Rhodococcus sp. ARC_M6]|uniref:hypothetical protein n=1 Tax=Rhodococcus sp. ARC_M6 TaxID=2928852 RepID=UPI001FB55E30|nr:hypothetical protein [Rhodococcus sp. ARC_M6]MCJ0904231.1 hypothetical protein [Rhodococcus sp. ARC_M6]
MSLLLKEISLVAAPISTRTRQLLARPRTRAVGGAVLIGLCGSMLVGCTQAQSSVASAPGDGVAATTTPAPSPRTASVHRLRDAVLAGGGESQLPDDTLQALGDGICRQLRAGTDRATIIANVRPMAHNGATGNPSQLQDTAIPTDNSAAPTISPDADRLAAVIVDAAEADYC